MKHIKVIDSHTGGEPTRIVIEGGPELGNGTILERLGRFKTEFDHVRRAVVNEPRGSDVLVGGLICPPTGPEFATGIIFFNNTGFLGMCGHGAIGLMVTLKHLGHVSTGTHLIETPVGPIAAELFDDDQVAIKNVASYRFRADVAVEVPGYGTVSGDIAWGGNWFFLVKNSGETLKVENSDHLTRVALKIRVALTNAGVRGAEGALIDHIEFFGPPEDDRNHSRNFVLCPGGAYDRSPCGTGTSAKLACLAADGSLAPGQTWRQESIVGSVFECEYQIKPQPEPQHRLPSQSQIVPTIRGTAFVCGESTLILNPKDPFCMGIAQ